MEIIQENNEKNGAFIAIDQGKQAGLMAYTWAGSAKFLIDHTEVAAAFRGQDIGQQLVLAAVAYARTNQLKILPLCPFAKSVFEKNPPLSDVLF